MSPIAEAKNEGRNLITATVVRTTQYKVVYCLGWGRGRTEEEHQVRSIAEKEAGQLASCEPEWLL